LFTVIGLDESDAWRKVLGQFKTIDTYHLLEYQRLSAPPDARPALLVVEIGRLLAALPLILRRLPSEVVARCGYVLDAVSAYGYPGLLSTIGQEDVEADALGQAFLRGFTAGLRALGVLSVFIRQNPLIPTTWLFGSESCEVVSSPVVTLDLALSREQRLAVASSDHRRALRRLAKTDIRVCRYQSEWAEREFIRIYAETMSRHGADPAYEYTQEQLHYLLQTLGDHAQLWLAVLRGEVISGSLNLRTAGIVQGYLSASAAAARSIGAFHLVVEEMADAAQADGDRWFSIGGGVGGQLDGVFAFKTSLSPYQSIFDTARMVIDAEAYNAACPQPAGEGRSSTDFFPAYRSIEEGRPEGVLPPLRAVIRDAARSERAAWR
jgi:hypothetical protein